MSSEGTGRCCICAKREPIACGVCIGVSALDVDVTWYVRRMNDLHATIADLRQRTEAPADATSADELARFRERTSALLAKWSGQDDRTVLSCAAELAHVLQGGS